MQVSANKNQCNNTVGKNERFLIAPWLFVGFESEEDYLNIMSKIDNEYQIYYIN